MMPVSAEYEEETNDVEPSQPEMIPEQDSVNYKQKYKVLKKKLRILVHEQECFMEELRKAQRKLLKVSRDRSFLLDRLLQYEKVDDSSCDSDATASSDSEGGTKKNSKKKKLIQQGLGLFPEQSPGMVSTLDMISPQQQFLMGAGGGGPSAFPMSSFLSHSAAAHSLAQMKVSAAGEPMRKKMKTTKKSKQSSLISKGGTSKIQAGAVADQLSREEIEKKLAESASKPSYMRIDKAPTSVPLDIFSNEDSNPDSENVEVDSDLVIDIPPGE